MGDFSVQFLYIEFSVKILTNVQTRIQKKRFVIEKTKTRLKQEKEEEKEKRRKEKDLERKRRHAPVKKAASVDNMSPF